MTDTLTYMQTLALDLVGPACIVTKGFDAAVQVDEEGLQEGFPRVQSLQSLKRKTRIIIKYIFFPFLHFELKSW